MLYYSHPKERTVMITINYRDEIGDVQASFDSLDEYEKFRDEFILKAKTRKEAEAARYRAEQEQKDKEAKARCDELTADAKRLIAKSIDYGMSPNGFVDLIKSSVLGAARDCFLERMAKHADAAESEDDDGDADGDVRNCAGIGIRIPIG